MVSIRRKNMKVEVNNKAELVTVLQQELLSVPADKKLYVEISIDILEEA